MAKYEKGAYTSKTNFIIIFSIPIISFAAMKLTGLHIIWSYLTAVNFVALIYFLLDIGRQENKSHDYYGYMRIPNSSFLLLALMGGSIILSAAMLITRHKHGNTFFFYVILILLLQIVIIWQLIEKGVLSLSNLGA